MIRIQPESTHDDTLFPFTTLFRSMGLRRAPARAPLECREKRTSSRATGGRLSLRPDLLLVGHVADDLPAAVRLPPEHVHARLHRGDRSAAGGRRTAEPSEAVGDERSEEHTSELQSLMRLSYVVYCLKKKT